MKVGEYIKKTTSVVLYLCVIYYLLPFRPMYLYYSAHRASTAILNELKKEKDAQAVNTLTFNKQFSQNNDTFPKKDGVRFFFKTGFTIATPPANEFVFFTKDEIRIFLHPCYQPPLISFNSTRGPPLV